MNISGIRQHFQPWTRLKTAKEKIVKQFAPASQPEAVRWDIASEQKAIEFLAGRALANFTKHPDKKVVVVGGNDKVSEILFKTLKEKKITTELLSSDEMIRRLASENSSTVACIVAGFFDAKNTMRIRKFLVSNENTREIPFEHILMPQLDFRQVEKFDRYQTSSFTSPIFAGKINYLNIYEESLTIFQQKCDIRDYLDMSQTLNHIAKNNIPGDIAEFGSFREPSGYFIVQALKQPDMFESFPSEGLGVDYFWKDHTVDDDEVSSKFVACSNVELVKGYFTNTIMNYPDAKFSYIFMDCDSCRATKFLVIHLFDKQLSAGGLMVLEDYGHPALLGNRLSVHECFDNRKNCFTFYSQFSGFYIVLKIS